MLELNSIQLYKILKRDKITQKTFLGVFPRNYLPKKLKYPCCFIINTHPSYKSGEHWLAFYYNKDGFCHFFDSFGMPPQFYGLQSYIEKTSNGWSYNSKRIQSLKSYFCGFYSFIFLFLKARNLDIKSFNFNDKTIKTFFKKLFKR